MIIYSNKYNSNNNNNHPNDNDNNEDDEYDDECMVGSQVQIFRWTISHHLIPSYLSSEPSRPKFSGCLQTLSLSWPPHGKGFESPKLSSSRKM